ncbi:MAG: hypothetical protein LKJ84_00580 [Bacilli bacterium]|jgi:hypothetical protein|nr:hypothetical protein [Bacilli bacterium]
MNLSFDLNDYLLIWNLLFLPSVTNDVQRLKEKLWKNYRHLYKDLYKEEARILKDPKNYIPDDDTIFDMVKETEAYKRIRKETEEYRLFLMHYYNEIKKELVSYFKELVRFDIKIYHVLVLNPRFNSVEMKTVKSRKVNTISWGMMRDQEDGEMAVIDILSHILKKELKDYESDYKEIVEAIIELAIDNELSTRIKGKSCYLKGDNSLKFLKKQIYPYFLMYLGSSRDDMLNYMVRDGIVFDVDKYSLKRSLATYNLKEFITFCIENQKYILKIEELEII